MKWFANLPMTFIDVILFPFSTIIFISEIWTGYAVIGWSGDRSVIEKAKNPGPYWLALTVQAICWFGVTAIWVYARYYNFVFGL
jgi:hypothetical protein